MRLHAGRHLRFLDDVQLDPGRPIHMLDQFTGRVAGSPCRFVGEHDHCMRLTLGNEADLSVSSRGQGDKNRCEEHLPWHDVAPNQQRAGCITLIRWHRTCSRTVRKRLPRICDDTTFRTRREAPWVLTFHVFIKTSAQCGRCAGGTAWNWPLGSWQRGPLWLRHRQITIRSISSRLMVSPVRS